MTSIRKDELERFALLLEDVLECIFDDNGIDAAMEVICDRLRELLDVECVGVFVVDDTPDVITLRRHSIDKGEYVPPTSRPIKVGKATGGGLTAFLATLSDVTALTYDEVKNHECRTGASPDYLPSGECYSLLAIPLRDRNGNLLGLIKAENKKRDGSPRSEVVFSDADVRLSKRLRKRIISVLDKMQLLQFFRRLTESIHESHTVGQISDAVLREFRNLFRADRVDLALWSTARKQLIVAGSHGVGSSFPFSQWDLVPLDSLIMSVWKSTTSLPVYYPDVSIAPRGVYFVAHERTQSQIAMRLEVNHKPIGVISLESFDKDGFDSNNQQRFRQVVKHAARAVHLVGGKAHLTTVRRPIDGANAPSRAVLDHIINCVLRHADFDAGIIYIADIRNGMLRCSAHFDTRSAVTKDIDGWSFDFNASSAASEIWRTQEPLVCDNPAENSIFDRQGLSYFDIFGPWVGLPLTYGNRVVGVLGIWSNKASQAPKDIVDSLRPFVRMACAYMVRPTVQEAKIVDEAPDSKINPSLDNEVLVGATDLVHEKNLLLIWLGIKAAGFDRARVFLAARETRTFRYVAFVGSGDPGFINGSVESPYTQYIFETFLSHPTARLFDPTDPTMFGPDPYACLFGKDPDVPWVVAPIIVGGELFGQIAADRAISRRGVTDEGLEYLTLTSSLVALEIEKVARRRRETALQENAVLFESLVNHMSGMYLFRKDISGRFTFATDGFCRLIGKSRSQIIGTTDFDHFPADVASEYQARDRLVLQRGDLKWREEEFSSAVTGSMKLDVFKTRVYDTNGKLAGIQGICWDVTPRVVQIVREVNHRVRNNLAIVEVMFEEARSRCVDGILKSYLQSCQSRVFAMAEVHKLLQTTAHPLRIFMPDYLKRIIEGVSQSHCEERISVEVDIAGIFMHLSQAVACGLIVNELVTNSFKHAFQHAESGLISVSLVSLHDAVRLTVQDNGSGFLPHDAKDKSSGQGLQFVRHWARHDLRALVEIESCATTTATIEFPWEKCDLLEDDQLE